MSVNVPIGKGIGKTTNQIKFPNLKTSQPEFKEKMPPTPNDQAFFKLLDDEGRFVLEEGSRTTDGEVISITPPTGTTFYYMGASCANVLAGNQTALFTLSINGVDKQTIRLGDGIGGGPRYEKFSFPTASVVGNGINNIAIDVDTTQAANNFATIWGYNETTPTQRFGGANVS